MRGICPKCHKVGYLILEKPRAKNQKPYLRHRRNKPTKSYDTVRRARKEYFRFSHYNSNPCYIGCLEFAIKKLERKMIVDNANERLDHDYNFNEFVASIKKYFDKNYTSNSKDSLYIYKIIKSAQTFKIINPRKRGQASYIQSV